MRNPFKRQPRPADKPGLRERLAATREKFGRTLRVHRALNAPAATSQPAPDRAALVNYATFLAWERNRVCAELYPHLGGKAAGFVLGMNAADRFFHGSDATGPLPASTRAVNVLDAVGIDWRSDPPGDGIERGIGLGLVEDTGERPALPEGWPAPDADLVQASGDLLRLDAAIAELLRGTDCDPKAVPGYVNLDHARNTALAVLFDTRARSLDGLQAKARAMLSPEVGADLQSTERLGESLARDLLAATGATITPRPDPILAAIEACRLVMRDGDDEALTTARDDLLQIVPTTGAGCRALARFAVEFFEDQGRSLEDADGAVLELIARSPAL